MSAGRPIRRLVLLLAAASAMGCDPEASRSPTRSTPTDSATRAARRLFAGAPPVIPHAPLNIKCLACHTDTGQEAPPLGFAPANPHARTAGLSATSHCQQCHVFDRHDEAFVANDFRGLSQQFTQAERLYPGAPPVIPHRIFMRENCLSCHSGPAARAEIRCSHPLRANCRQCHVPGDEAVAPPPFATAAR